MRRPIDGLAMLAEKAPRLFRKGADLSGLPVGKAPERKDYPKIWG